MHFRTSKFGKFNALALYILSKLDDFFFLSKELHKSLEKRKMGKFKYFLRSMCNFQVLFKVSKGAKIRNRYNQVPHLTQDTNGKVTNSQ